VKSRRCSRAWLAEAVRDGRVQGQERDGFERHAMTCPECAAEADELEDLGLSLRELPALQPDALSSLRQRRQLMADIDAASMGRATSGSSLRSAAWWTLGAAAAAAAVVLLGPSVRDHFFHAWSVASEEVVEARPEPGARWSQAVAVDFYVVHLEEGALWLRIHRPRASSKVVIEVPDGEIEDFGTVLTVRVTGGRTIGVVVDEGDVVLRLRGASNLHVRAGESWSAQDEPVRASPAPTLAQGVELPRPVTSTAVHPKAAHPARALAADDTVGRHVAVAPESSVEIDAGNAEDSAYVEVLDLLRAGKSSAARAAARNYLQRFPNGFRRIEIMDVATGRAPPR
jgi:hypothetical protein